jgi:hypothetical protein
LLRTKEREHDFTWLYKVGKINIKLYGAANRVDLKINTQKDISKHRLILKRGDATVTFFENITRNSRKKHQLVIESKQALKMLLRNRGDLYPMSTKEFNDITQLLHIDPNLFAEYYDFSNDAQDLYVAISRKSDVELQKNLRLVFSCK